MKVKEKSASLVLPIENLEGEIWKDVVGYEGCYMISNLGRVMSMSRVVPRKLWGKDTELPISNKILRPDYHEATGYYFNHLCKNAKREKQYHHRLIATAFIENPENKPEVNHINSIRTDNSIKNLEWVTRSENMKHCFKSGRSNILSIAKYGKDNYAAKAINQKNRDGSFVARWDSLADFIRSRGSGSASHICSVLKGRRKSAYGFLYEYAA